MRRASPVIDLLYNVFGASDRPFRKNDYPQLIEHYYSVLQQQIRKLGSDPDVLFPHTVFQDHLKRFAKIAFLMAPLMVEVFLANSKDIPNLDEMAEKMKNGGDVRLVQHQDEHTRQKYKNRLSELLTDLIDLGYCWK